MADLGTLITIADKVFQLLQSPVLKDMRDWESDLQKLNKSVSFIKDMLLDADTKPELSHGEQRWVDELNEVLYEADDLFDEVITIAKQKELDATGAKFSKKVLDKGLPEFEEVFKTFSSLRKLEIRWCSSLTSVSGVLEHLTTLESLSLDDILVVDEEFNNDMPWRSLRHNLRSLTLVSLDNLQMLPRGMKYLTALESLAIKSCNSLKSLPEWISCLSSLQFLTIDSCPGLKSLGAIQNITSLQKLEILDCPELREACQEPSGKEWPNIRHIPHFSISIYKW